MFCGLEDIINLSKMILVWYEYGMNYLLINIMWLLWIYSGWVEMVIDKLGVYICILFIWYICRWWMIELYV